MYKTVFILLLIVLISFGLEYLPKQAYHSTIDSRLIFYNASNHESAERWAMAIDEHLEPYRKNNNALVGRIDCRRNALQENQVCDVPIDEFWACTSEHRYSFAKGSPCIFLKPSKISNWIPEPYNTTKDLPTDMPLDLKEHIANVEKSDPSLSNRVWVTCKGDSNADQENIGPINYIPSRGFPASYFPVTNEDQYLSPLIAVWFEKPMYGVTIVIKCQAWARNIDRGENLGTVHFELLVDT